MLNQYTPYPRYENAIFIGDKAVEVLGALKIFSMAIIGGTIPSIETLHPSEKPLECISCAMHNKPAILDTAVKKLNVDYVLLEDNGQDELNPASMKASFEADGVAVKVLDVVGDTATVLRRAGQLMQAERHAERLIDDMATRDEMISKVPVRPGIRLMSFLGMRQPVHQEGYLFHVTAGGDLHRALVERFGVVNVCPVDAAADVMPGVAEIEDFAAQLREGNPDVIAFTGEASVGMKRLRQAVKADPTLRDIPAIRDQAVFALPYYCDDMAPRLSPIMQIWAEVLSDC